MITITHREGSAGTSRFIDAVVALTHDPRPDVVAAYLRVAASTETQYLTGGALYWDAQRGAFTFTLSLIPSEF